MTLSELRYLVAVADLRHFSRAAERCHITQPTLSVQLRKLEEFLGVTLFERGRRSVTITPVGERIVTHARRILEEADQISELARQDKGVLASPLRLGVIPTLGPYLLPLFLRPLHEKYPDLRLILREDLTDHLLAALATHELDALLLALPSDGQNRRVMALFDEPFWFACPQDHPLAARADIDEADLAGQKLLLLDEGHCLRDQALAICGDQARETAWSAEDVRATSLETICELVAAGLGCTVLPALAVRRLAPEGSRIAVRPLRGGLAHRRIGLMWRTGFSRGDDLLALGMLIQAQVPPALPHAG